MFPRGKITLVLFFFAICAVAALSRFGGLGEDQLKPADLFEAVRGQMEACRSGDYPSAYRQTSATVREKCPPERFADQVRNDSARMVQAARVEFGPWQRRGRRAVVEVFFIGRDGTVTPCVYSLVSEAQAWKIEGTRWLAPSRQTLRMGGLRS
ncbi:MAG: DUF4864 domain-containing protein [Chthoniobacteraceae bacterium]